MVNTWRIFIILHLHFSRPVHGIQFCEPGRDYLPLFHLRVPVLQTVLPWAAHRPHRAGQNRPDQVQLGAPPPPGTLQERPIL